MAGMVRYLRYLRSGTGAWRPTRRVHPAAVAPPAGSASPVRRRRPRDLAACARLLRLVYAEGQYPVYWPDAPRAFLADPEVMDAWVAESRGELVGHVAICDVGRDPVAALRWREITGRRPDQLAGVSRLFVRPRARGQGIGSALLDVAVREIRARGLLPVLEVVTANRDAIALYDARGWQLAGIYDWGRPADRLRVRYYLAPVTADDRG